MIYELRVARVLNTYFPCAHYYSFRSERLLRPLPRLLRNKRRLKRFDFTVRPRRVHVLRSKIRLTKTDRTAHPVLNLRAQDDGEN